MRLSSITLNGFRNYQSLTLELPEVGAHFSGLNGAGKTNLLEAIHMLCLGRSQRGAVRSEMIGHGLDAACIEGEFTAENNVSKTVARMGFSRDKRVSMELNGRSVESLREWFGNASVVSFGPDDLNLIVGPPAQRRRFLDMLICQIDSTLGDYITALMAYQKALLNRNKILASHTDESLLDVYESAMAKHGSFISKKRDEIIAFCQPLLAEFYREICGGRESASVEYRPSGFTEIPGSSTGENVFYNLLKNKRKQDIVTGFTTVGPHRDEIIFRLDGKHAGTVASQGQCRSLALALKLASVSGIEQFKNEAMIFLVDDAFAELDETRIASLYPLLRHRGQVFMATPGSRFGEIIDLPRFSVNKGTILSAP